VRRQHSDRLVTWPERCAHLASNLPITKLRWRSVPNVASRTPWSRVNTRRPEWMGSGPLRLVGDSPPAPSLRWAAPALARSAHLLPSACPAWAGPALRSRLRCPVERPAHNQERRSAAQRKATFRPGSGPQQVGGPFPSKRRGLHGPHELMIDHTGSAHPSRQPSSPSSCSLPTSSLATREQWAVLVRPVGYEPRDPGGASLLSVGVLTVGSRPASRVMAATAGRG
jgi:hypothetical protein